ncbi:CAMKK protein kinase [Capronia epimyces CBS 606.96]|uniref:non-specific serine/threonine protein kinase n=1 Tax=Capronia epimyces CBS 606.96 TaxID=1182542 RepID=W9XK41_9EURO|nr:CAMKK protein kinase [Capronia epimyces CBS 606.96]EXJ77725.1 CAMKK protein kinase [Capronia epimyces CBS 606.96]
MSDNVGIRWALDLQHARHNPESAGDMSGLTRITSRENETNSQELDRGSASQSSGGDSSSTQRNTPIALAAQNLAEPVDDNAFGRLDAHVQQGVAVSPGLPSSRSHPSLPSSTQTSSNSLKSMFERELERGKPAGTSTVHRALSTKSTVAYPRRRRPSHSKSLSHSLSTSKRTVNADRPTYPDQSFAALQVQFPASRPPPLRTRSSHPAQNLLYNEMSTWAKPTRDRQSNCQGTKTADNTPMSSPGLFNPEARVPSSPSLTELGAQLHHLQEPKETHTAEIEHDTYSGNKFINNYEIVQELGRGEHGKVKLGRDIEKGTLVAVKIVPRYSVKRRLGRLGTPEDRTKREVAILKKARHPNVVSLLEVIDDPNKNKVYLILEYVERGEIKWRKRGVREILAVNNNRFVQERLGIQLPLEPVERDLFNIAQAKRRHEQQEKARAAASNLIPNWSLEHGGDELDDDEGLSDISRSGSRHFYESNIPSRTGSHEDYADIALAGSMYGAYTPDAYHNSRKFSIATSAVSHMSSEWNLDENDDEKSYVPAMTLEEARGAFRDTLSGLEFLHFIGIIHRDIKPANLLVTSNGTVKISDFGVSYLGRPTTDEDPENKLTENDVSALDDEKELARSVGTPAFWAPELCYEDPSMFEEKNGPKITGALDLWALGITLYCMVYARLPFYATEDMGLHEAVCKAEVFLPSSRLVPVDTSRDRPTYHVPTSINSNKRLDYELKFELVPEGVRDLIRRLLVKDPAKRMTILEAKRHEWVVEGMHDPSEWFKGPPEMEKESKKKILEVDEKELSHAVGKRNIIERALNTAGRLAGSLLGRSNTRKRAPSAATSASHSRSSDSIASASPSIASTAAKNERDRMRDVRRTSLRGDEVLAALKTSRENTEHPLAQSQTASPDTSPHENYFGNSLLIPTAASTGVSPMQEREGRPRIPDRAISILSTTESVKTIKASQMQRHPSPLHDSSPSIVGYSTHDRSLKARVDGLWEGTAKTLARLGSRDRRSQRSEHSPVSSRHSSEGDGHTRPSIAVSTASAAGAIEPPDALRTPVTSVDGNTAPPLPQMQATPYPRTVFQAPASTEEAFEQARDINQRRLIQEAHQQAVAAAEASSRRPNETTVNECPPSPDDMMFLERQRTKVSNDPPQFSIGSSGPSASTIASSIDGYGASSVSQSISDPSFGVESGASSPPGEGFMTMDQAGTPADVTAAGKDIEPAFMRTADTITKHGRPTQTATGPSLEDWQNNSYEYHHDDDDDSDEDAMMMGVAQKKF